MSQVLKEKRKKKRKGKGVAGTCCDRCRVQIPSVPSAQGDRTRSGKKVMRYEGAVAGSEASSFIFWWKGYKTDYLEELTRM